MPTDECCSTSPRCGCQCRAGGAACLRVCVCAVCLRACVVCVCVCATVCACASVTEWHLRASNRGTSLSRNAAAISVYNALRFTPCMSSSSRIGKASGVVVKKGLRGGKREEREREREHLQHSLPGNETLQRQKKPNASNNKERDGYREREH
jgi:hypothetical protein